MAAEQDLGAAIERFESDNGRRRRIVAVAVPVGTLVACVAGMLTAVVAGGGGPTAPVLS